MEIIETGDGTATVRLTRRELTLLANALNETREAVEEWEFSTRVGAESTDAEELQRKLKALLTSIRDTGS